MKIWRIPFLSNHGSVFKCRPYLTKYFSTLEITARGKTAGTPDSFYFDETQMAWDLS